MKTIIRWLADVSGVSRDIESETCKYVGSNMEQYAHWFTGGILVKGHKYDMSNILYEYPKHCLNHGAPHLFGSQFVNVRQKLWGLSDKGKSIIVEENKPDEQQSKPI